jgi:hypothetical protein
VIPSLNSHSLTPESQYTKFVETSVGEFRSMLGRLQLKIKTKGSKQ